MTSSSSGSHPHQGPPTYSAPCKLEPKTAVQSCFHSPPSHPSASQQAHPATKVELLRPVAQLPGPPAASFPAAPTGRVARCPGRPSTPSSTPHRSRSRSSKHTDDGGWHWIRRPLHPRTGRGDCHCQLQPAAQTRAVTSKALFRVGRLAGFAGVRTTGVRYRQQIRAG